MIIRLNFYGYTWEDFKWQIADLKGILLVYRGKLDPEGFTVMEQILHIGYTSINKLYEMPLMNQIKKDLTDHDMLFFSYADVEESVAEEVESLLIEIVKPRYSKKGVVSSNLIIENNGKCIFLPNLISSNNNKDIL